MDWYTFNIYSRWESFAHFHLPFTGRIHFPIPLGMCTFPFFKYIYLKDIRTPHLLNYHLYTLNIYSRWEFFAHFHLLFTGRIHTFSSVPFRSWPSCSSYLVFVVEFAAFGVTDIFRNPSTFSGNPSWRPVAATPPQFFVQRVDFQCGGFFLHAVDRVSCPVNVQQTRERRRKQQGFAFIVNREKRSQPDDSWKVLTRLPRGCGTGCDVETILKQDVWKLLQDIH